MATKTIPDVELVKVGRWEISTGPWIVTPRLLAAAVAAHASGTLPRPIVKLGHTDERFDGEPALGGVDNLRTTDGGRTLVGDLVDIPTWLSDIAASAYPRRSVEAAHDVVMQDGTKHALVITAVSLLGVTRPGITTLADLRSLHDVAASSGTPVTLAHRAAAPTLDNLSSRQRATVRAAATRRRHRTAAEALRIHESS